MTGGAAKVYSEALFELAEENGTEEETGKELSAVSEIFKSEPDLSRVLCAPTVSESEKTGLLTKIFGKKISDMSVDFLCLLSVKGRIGELEGIASAYRSLWCRKAGILEVKVVSAVPLTDSQRTKLAEGLTKKYGKKIIMSEKTDPDILGGVIVSFGDTMLDGSVRTRLGKLHQNMKDVIA